MKPRKIIGVIVVLVGLVLVAGAASSGYGIVAPVTMMFVVLIGLALLFWERVSALMR